MDELDGRKIYLQRTAERIKERKMSTFQVEDFLLNNGWVQHIEYGSGEGKKLAEEDPERFKNIGKYTTNRFPYLTDEEYDHMCIHNLLILTLKNLLRLIHLRNVLIKLVHSW